MSCSWDWFVDFEESEKVFNFFKDIMPFILMASHVLSSQDVSVKKDLLQKALFVHRFMDDNSLLPTVIFHEVNNFIERLKASFPEHSEVKEFPKISTSGIRVQMKLLGVCQKLEKLMLPPRLEFGPYCSLGRCIFCGKGEHFYSDEEMNDIITYICPKCKE